MSYHSNRVGGVKMRKSSAVLAGLLVVFMVSLPVAAEAHWRGGRVFFGFGAGLLTGYLLAPRPVYVVPPVYVPPPPVSYPYYVPMPAPRSPSVSAYSNNRTDVGPPPGDRPKCREWGLIERHLKDRWNSYSGTWQAVPVEKWGWIDVPCTK
jgi:hypothetical protein